MDIKRLVITAWTPHSTEIVSYAQVLSDLPKVDSVIIRVGETDKDTKTIQIRMEGEALSLERIRKRIEKLGGAISSIDEVAAGGRGFTPK